MTNILEKKTSKDFKTMEDISRELHIQNLVYATVNLESVINAAMPKKLTVYVCEINKGYPYDQIVLKTIDDKNTLTVPKIEKFADLNEGEVIEIHNPEVVVGNELYSDLYFEKQLHGVAMCKLAMNLEKKELN